MLEDTFRAGPFSGYKRSIIISRGTNEEKRRQRSTPPIPTSVLSIGEPRRHSPFGREGERRRPHEEEASFLPPPSLSSLLSHSSPDCSLNLRHEKGDVIHDHRQPSPSSAEECCSTLFTGFFLIPSPDLELRACSRR